MKRLIIAAVGLALVAAVSACGNAKEGAATQPTPTSDLREAAYEPSVAELEGELTEDSSFACGGSDEAEYLALALLTMLDLHWAGQGLQGFALGVPPHAPMWDVIFDDYRETIEFTASFADLAPPDSLADFAQPLSFALSATENAYVAWDAEFPYPWLGCVSYGGSECDLEAIEPPPHATEMFFDSAGQFREAAFRLNSTCWEE